MRLENLIQRRCIMTIRIKNFSDGSYLEFDNGKFDEWCVYLTLPGHARYSPRDIEYFSKIKNLAIKYSPERIYYDFVNIYDNTTKSIDNNTLLLISKIADTYGEDRLEIDIVFSILYSTMIAEENKKNTQLGKRIKRLGMHILLIENSSADHAANFMRGKNWREISTLCKERRF